MRTAAALAGLLGGVAWIAAFVLDKMDRAGPADIAAGIGLVLLAVAAVAAGAGLVSRSASWLRVVVAICFALLVWSVLQVLSDGINERLVQGLAGLVGAVVGLVVLARKPAPVHASVASRSRGSHAR